MNNEFLMKNHSGNFTSRDIRDCEDLDELDGYERQVNNDILSMEVRIKASERDSEVDQNWLNGIQIALKVQKALRYLIGIRRSQLKRMKKYSLDKYVLKLVREGLGEEAWQILIRRAKNKRDEDYFSEREKDI